MARIELTVKMNGIYSYERAAYGYGTETAYIYNMEAEDGTVYVWKTTAFMGFFVDDKNGHFRNNKGVWQEFYKVNKGDVIRIKATVKGQSEYNGQPQTELMRVAVLERIFAAETWEQRQERIKAEKEAQAKEQRNSLEGEDFIWRMPYKQFKEHYSDCETVAGSFKREDRRPCTIEVIVREEQAGGIPENIIASSGMIPESRKEEIRKTAEQREEKPVADSEEKYAKKEEVVKQQEENKDKPYITCPHCGVKIYGYN